MYCIILFIYFKKKELLNIIFFFLFFAYGGSIKFILTGNHPISSSYFISFTIFGNCTLILVLDPT